MRRRKRLSTADCFGEWFRQLHFQLLLCDPVARAGLGAGAVLGLFLRALGAVDMGWSVPPDPSAPFVLPRGETSSWGVAL